MLTPNIKRACLAAVVLFPVTAYGSLGGAPCRADFACHFVTWGIFAGVVVAPVSGLIFALLHWGFCHHARSRLTQFFLGGFIGMLAYEISTACGALLAASGKAPPGRETDYLLIGLAPVYLGLALASVLHVRSRPRGGGGDAS